MLWEILISIGNYRGTRIILRLLILFVRVLLWHFRVDKNEDLQFLERGISIDEFSDYKEQRKPDMEFRVL